MEKWYDIVRKLQDESENKYLTRVFCEEVFHDLYNGKIKEKQKFKNRMGPEYESFVASLEYPPELIDLVLGNDEFFLLTLELQQKFRR